MKKACNHSWCLALLGFVEVAACAQTATLDLSITPQFAQSNLAFNQPIYTNAAGQSFSVARLDFLLSKLAVHDPAGPWLEQTNWQACFSTSRGGMRSSVPNLPRGHYDRVRFHVGLPPDLNHSNPAKYPAGHPLNPVVNGLHWSWAGGYVFFAIEGHWRKTVGELSGYSYHLGDDPMLMTVEIPVALNLNNDQSLALDLDLARVFHFEFNDEHTSTHSRKGDVFAAALKVSVESAFRLSEKAQQTCTESLTTKPAEPTAPFLVGLTPYRFSFSDQFPMPELPRDNPLSDEGVELGRRLFSETKLSVNSAQSCASCHNAEAGFTDSGKRYSLGAEGQEGTRNSMPLFNLAWKKSFFWDGRAPALRAQVLVPIQNPVEMHESLEHVSAKLSAMKDYRDQFQKVFGPTEVNAERIGLALEQFLLTLVSCDSKFDRALRDEEKLTEEESRGFELFITEYDPRRGQFGADCFHCHGGPLFQSQSFANNGLDSVFVDKGLQAATGKESDRGKFAVPSLRNVAVTAPYMHDGRFKTLEEVIEHYSNGLKRSATLDPNLAKHPAAGIQLSSADKKALVAFLKTLTDSKFKAAQVARAP